MKPTCQLIVLDHCNGNYDVQMWEDMEMIADFCTPNPQPYIEDYKSKGYKYRIYKLWEEGN